MTEPILPRVGSPFSRWPDDAYRASVIGIAILIGLGVWQVQRLHWKEALLAKIAALQRRPPIPIGAGACRRGRQGTELDFVRVTANCPDIETTPYLKLYAVREVAGFRLITPCAELAAAYKTHPGRSRLRGPGPGSEPEGRAGA